MPACTPDPHFSLSSAWARAARVLLLAALVALLLPALCSAQAPAGASAASGAAPADAATLLAGARADMQQAARTAAREDADDAEILEGRRRAQSAQLQAEQAASLLAAELASVQARLSELGAPAEGVQEPQDIAAQRQRLSKQQSELDADVKLARLLAVEAEQAAAAASAERRARFNAELFARVPALTDSDYWSELRAESRSDLRRMDALNAELRERLLAVPWGAWLAAAGFLAALLLLRRLVSGLALAMLSSRSPAGRLRRSARAAGTVLSWTLTVGLGAEALVVAVAVSAGEGASAGMQTLLTGFAGIAWFAGFCLGLGLGLLMPGKPSWRLPPLGNATALRLRWFPLSLALAMLLGFMLTRYSASAQLSLAAAIAFKTLSSLLLLAVLGLALLRLRRARRAADASRAEARPLWQPTLLALATVALVVALLGLLTGYVALATFLINQSVWALVLGCTAYLLAVLVDDLLMAFLAPTEAPPAATAAQADAREPARPEPRTREQTAVLLSGLFRVALAVFSLMLLLAPFGEGPLELFQRAERFNEGIAIGELSLLPGTLLQGALLLVLGLLAVRAVKGWLANRFMPTTRMDAGMRVSITTMFGYVGAVVVVALTMSAMGVGLERVAWVASALSVGIGFGLQAVVQNFVSGLILLAERPVKVGDWVSLPGVEGDIRRINVRATEIQMGDRSTVIVPNSEFITKVVRNVTYTDPLGMVQIKLPLPLNTDARAAREILLGVYREHPGVLDAPAPNVQLDSVDGKTLLFNCTGFVSSPRAVYGVKSDLLFQILERLAEHGLVLSVPQEVVWTAAGARAPRETQDGAPAAGPAPLP